MDLVESGDQYLLRADLPGLSDGDVNIQLQENVLTISGERTTEPRVAASETGISLNRAGAIAWWRCRYGVVGPSRRRTRVSTELQSCYLAEAFWNVAPAKGQSLVMPCEA
jgi:hypothetical protein